ncbi:CCA tRNA nucleotidyltransferase [Cellulomonas soli]|uniref:Multifunctional CCA protein n=1 Tax=Cellulomonas soli TaxID=931535 RepID=A0A512PH87_9CELL|nr:HD domain-containing protein [Cellulomonas soli]NYI60828.1 tRNA nucleotidyltransferase (CCA-adding enzyme) [Cellulomonas soli]GEP70588.1 multifunctional CCA protein [Cellulomonas soli]
MTDSRGLETRHHRPGLLALSPTTKQLLGAVEHAGGHPYLVGGCVRDAILTPGTRPKDVDIEVYGLEPDRLVHELRRFGYVDEVGARFTVLKLRTGGEDLDIALPRRTVRTEQGHEVVADPYAPLVEASGRRDFTVNALMLDPVTDEVVDCWDGLGDLRSGVLRHTTSSFAEDPLRVLRGAQLAARFDLTMAPETVELSRSLTDEHATIARERIWGEWHKTVTRGVRPSRALRVLAQTGWEGHYPQLAVLHGVRQDPGWHPEGDVHTHIGLAADKACEVADRERLTGDDRAVVVLASMLHDVGKHTHTRIRVRQDGQEHISSAGHAGAGVEPARAFLRSIGAPRHLRDRVLPLIREHMAATGNDDPSPAAVRRLARRLQPATMQEWAMVVESDKGGRGVGSVPGGTERWMELARRLGTERAPVRGLLRGAHLIAAGMEPGPEFAPILREAQAAQDDGEITDEAGAVAWLAGRIASGTVPGGRAAVGRP